MPNACLLSFQPITVENYADIVPYFYQKKTVAADYSALYFHMWNAFLHTEFAIEDGVLYMRRSTRHGTFYYPPMRRGSTDLLADIPLLANVVEGESISLCAIPDHEVERMESLYTVLEKNTSRRFADYIYAAEDLGSLRGHRYNKKRNLVHQFEKLYASTYEPLDTENAKEAAEMLRRMMSETEQSEDERFENERVLEVLRDFSRLPICGGLVRVEGAVAAFCVAERIDDTLIVHVEKADRAYKGAYQYINYRFVQEQMAEEPLAFVNREDDTGDEGLRHAKLSYHPVHILHKYRMVLKNDFGGGTI